ncbi:hypothetical protein PFISCL1PPCAC_25373, partial [Pristionchus fissidentatus]
LQHPLSSRHHRSTLYSKLHSSGCRSGTLEGRLVNTIVGLLAVSSIPCYNQIHARRRQARSVTVDHSPEMGTIVSTAAGLMHRIRFRRGGVWHLLLATVPRSINVPIDSGWESSRVVDCASVHLDYRSPVPQSIEQLQSCSLVFYS